VVDGRRRDYRSGEHEKYDCALHLVVKKLRMRLVVVASPARGSTVQMASIFALGARRLAAWRFRPYVLAVCGCMRLRAAIYIQKGEDGRGEEEELEHGSKMYNFDFGVLAAAATPA